MDSIIPTLTMDSVKNKKRPAQNFPTQSGGELVWWRGMVVRLGGVCGADLRRHLLSEIGRSLHLHSGPGVSGACTSTCTRAVSSVPPEPSAGYLVESVSEIATKKVKQ